jgi:hypothetical protein
VSPTTHTGYSLQVSADQWSLYPGVQARMWAARLAAIIAFASSLASTRAVAQCTVVGTDVDVDRLTLPSGQTIERAHVDELSASVSLRTTAPDHAELRLRRPIEAEATGSIGLALRDASVLPDVFFDDAAAADPPTQVEVRPRFVARSAPSFPGPMIGKLE